ncbi:uncharacterized protein BO72DRAFT_58190 [Aspergillus fijiensis CBS 313.89]|uniref:Uncharacterized protein n=1 Tax=Aspergillus fijiensis CBS 313.89 TaxID=1448319 RepID=A0A8G1W0P9_9EURO|nr:uncharacterized protein BO72DRAFT_58190 [Aspergillus fijiensis CBS 313.89]RAK78813.1 hypothetical protein BO72DRAFT_58190 [Aspergillus fijiensis CBS 313.89]
MMRKRAVGNSASYAKDQVSKCTMMEAAFVITRVLPYPVSQQHSIFRTSSIRPSLHHTTRAFPARLSRMQACLAHGYGLDISYIPFARNMSSLHVSSLPSRFVIDFALHCTGYHLPCHKAEQLSLSQFTLMLRAIVTCGTRIETLESIFAEAIVLMKINRPRTSFKISTASYSDPLPH